MSDGALGTGHPGEGHRSARKVLVVDADGPLTGLLQAWIGGVDCEVIVEPCGHAAEPKPVDLVIVDLPFPRQCGVDSVRRIAMRHPRTPILALSSTFFAGIECCGAVARALGVASVLPKPVSRDAVIDAVRRLLP